MKAGSNFEKILESGKFAVTAELGPPKSSNKEFVKKKASLLKGYVDAVNVTDNQTAVVRMSSFAASLIILEEGLEPVMQMVTRDRNRIALQSDILGAGALGIKNILCLSGDHQKFGNHPGAKGVFDIDSVQLLAMVKAMRDEKKFASGDEIKVEPRLFIGTACNPFIKPVEYQVIRFAKKIKAGADFVQTQAIYDVEGFKKFMSLIFERGLHKQTSILAGVVPLKSHRAALYMKSSVPGIEMPDSITERMEKAKDQKEEGISICVETIKEIKKIPGVRGVHIMAIDWEDKVPEITERAGLLPRPLADEL